MNGSIIRLEDVHFNYGDIGILKGIDIDIATDTFTVIVGRSGAGKSILLKIMATLMFPLFGTVKLFGNDVTGYDRDDLIGVKKRMAFAFQDGALLSNLSVEENLMLTLDFHFKDMSIEEKKKKITGYLKELDLEETLNQRPAQLSSGEKKIISIVRAMIIEPEILFLDEPLAFIDATVAKTIIGLVNDYAIKENTTVVCVSNSSRIITDYSDNVAILDNGKIAYHAGKDETLSPEVSSKYRVLNDVLGYNECS